MYRIVVHPHYSGFRPHPIAYRRYPEFRERYPVYREPLYRGYRHYGYGPHISLHIVGRPFGRERLPLIRTAPVGPPFGGPFGAPLMPMPFFGGMPPLGVPMLPEPLIGAGLLPIF